MPAHSPHGATINQAARVALIPLGLRRKGQSRLWYDDHGWRVFVVEFQPSSWSKGTYCNVGAMWLWDPNPDEAWAFHIHQRLATPAGEFASFDQDPSRFGDLLSMLAVDAAAHVGRLRSQFDDLESVASYYLNQAQVGWPGYHGGVALGLTGPEAEAEARFRSVAANAAGSHIEWIANLSLSASSLAELVHDTVAFRSSINAEIGHKRQQLRLPAVENPLPA